MSNSAHHELSAAQPEKPGLTHSIDALIGIAIAVGSLHEYITEGAPRLLPDRTTPHNWSMQPQAETKFTGCLEQGNRRFPTRPRRPTLKLFVAALGMKRVLRRVLELRATARPDGETSKPGVIA
jgi:hypothetical protein